jgi:hypothetical protein
MDYKKKPQNYFLNKKDCEDFKRENTNPKYPFFRQVNFTSGDVDQFQRNRDYFYPNSKESSLSLNKNLFYDKGQIENVDWKGYHNIDDKDIFNTFQYIFYKLKKGIFVKITNNQVTTFLPFSNVNFRNEWSNKIKVDPKVWNSITDFIIYASSLSGYKINERKINRNIDKWYSNNFLLSLLIFIA